MPVETCTVGSKDGYRYGGSGKCYTHDGSDAGKKRAKKQAVRQAIAIGGGKAPEGLSDRDLADAAMKTCSDCGKSRPLARFPDDARTSDGHSGTCVTCRFGSNHAEAFAELETVDLDGVELLSSGGPYFGDGSPEEGDFFEEDYLKELAQNAETLQGEAFVPIKIGHSRGQRLLKNSGLYTDEQPAAGWIENQRVAGGKLLGDLKKVPKKIADLIDVGAFRKRSVELSKIKSQTDDGKEYEVISALALLGAKAPAVRTLNDIVTAWYSDAEDGELDHMEETVRLMLADAVNDTGNRTVDLAEGDVIWDSENGSQDWQQDLTAALNANAGPTDGYGLTSEMTNPYYVQEIDQVNRKAIVCDWRTNTYWVVPFTIGSGSDSDDPIPAPFEQWTLAEQAWVQAANETATASNQDFAQHEEFLAELADTRTVSATAAAAKPEWTDEQVASFATGFGIEESDVAKRREAVEAKFAELAPKPEVKEEPKVEPPVDASVATLSQEEKDKLLADAAAGRTFAESQQKERREANIMACVEMGKIDPKDADHWRSFMESNYDLAVEALAKLPINKTLLASFGSDDNGDGAPGAAEEQFYRAYAAQTGVTPVERGKAA